ncbi:FHA domain-containing protein [Marisediminicola sp. LYQ134]|uniref:FHA domain-containing protein n=1 Tax=Marisediminicola sp. LYQ134 TaxID=3391061 RepID=UPI003983B19D
MSVHYAAAEAEGWFGVIRDGLAVVFDVEPGPAVVDAAWSAITGESALPALLDLLTRDGLSATPPFAVVDWTASTREIRAIVRGGVTLDVTDDEGAHDTLSGAGAATWIERHFSSVRSATLTVDAATVASSSPLLPVTAGAVVAASLSIELAVSEQGAPAVAPVPEPAPAEPLPVEPLPEESVPDESTLAATPSSDGDGDDDDDVSGDTVVRPRRNAAAAPAPTSADLASAALASADLPNADPPAAPEAEPATVPLAGDHDGETIMTSDIAALRGRRREAAATGSPAVLAQPRVSVRLPDGSRESLTQPVLVGRAPSVSKVSGGSLPRLVSLGTGDQDISRNHAQVALEGDTIVVTDLHSRNGTFVVLPGKSPQKLRAGEPTPVIVGTIIDLGGGISLTVDED